MNELIAQIFKAVFYLLQGLRASWAQKLGVASVAEWSLAEWLLGIGWVW